jgi:hypothetical protein
MSTAVTTRDDWHPAISKVWNFFQKQEYRGEWIEPRLIVRDLQDLLQWNRLQVVGTYGRNFIGRDSHALAWIPKTLRHGLAAVTETVLKWFPTLCSDIHVIGQKPA